MSQTWDPSAYAKDGRFVAELADPVVRLLAPRPGERILDLGCGDGVLTKSLADLGCVVTGVDSSPEMVEAAKSRGVDARLMDGQALVFEDEFDAVFSNAALHWMTQPDAVLSGVHKALRAGGRFVGEFGGHGNIAAVARALANALARRGLDFEALNPWYFPTAEEYRARLQAASFRVESCTLIPRPTRLAGDMEGWLSVFARVFIEALPEADRPDFVREVASRCEPELRSPDGSWTLDYVRLRFAAVKPA